MTLKLNTLALLLAVACGSLSAQTVTVKNAWARASVPGQTPPARS